MLLVGIIVFFVFQLAVNAFDIKIPVINPENKELPEENTFSFYYDYPSSDYVVPHIIVGENGTMEGLPLFSLTITYSYDGILTEGTDFFITARGSLYPEGQKSISRVELGYDGATFADDTFRNYPPLFNATLYGAECLTMQIPPQGNVRGLRIKWTATGDYYPYLVITHKNETDPIKVNIQDGKVHVFGIDTMRQEEHNREQANTSRRDLVIRIDSVAIGSLLTLLGYTLKVKPDKKIHSSRRQRYTKGKKNRKP